jgi:(E)-4-hydroxy-3-methylbut-2-enyl-diphosphate synthase
MMLGITRKITRQLKVRGVAIGGDAPVVVQSMCNTDIFDIESTLLQIEALYRAGCEIVRVAVPNAAAAKAFAKIRRQSNVPLVADIHFNHQLAVEAIKSGADKVRINPGNIGGAEKVKEVIAAAKKKGVPIRVGVNSGSVREEILRRHGGPTAEALMESAREYVEMIREFDFEDAVFSIKASDVPTTILACRAFAQQYDYPQHIGITESGTLKTGTIRSAVGLGTLLAEGIGDTIRVSLAGDPLNEIPVAREILKSLGLASGPMVIACPTCGRTQIDVADLARKVEEMVCGIKVGIKIAVMGCVVNGPGEAREADVGIAGGRGEGRVFVGGEVVEKVKEDELLDALMRHIRKFVGEANG